MGACYGGTDVMERSCAVARGKDINSRGRFEENKNVGLWRPGAENSRAQRA